MRKRIPLEIIGEILRLCKVPTKKTHLIYGCNLNFVIYKKYVEMLIRTGNLTYDETYYRTTVKGSSRLRDLAPVFMACDEVMVL